jgi:hypothetical protein
MANTTASYPGSPYTFSGNAAGNPSTALNSWLKKVIAPRIEEQLISDESLKWFKMLQKEKNMSMANNTMYVSLRTSRQSGIVFTAAGDKLASGTSAYAQAVIPAKYVFGTFDILDQTIEASKSQEGSLVRALTEITDTMRADMARDLNRVFWQAGDGILAVANGSGTTSTALTVKNRMSLTTTDTTKMAITPTEYLRPKQNIKIGSYTNLTTNSTGITATTVTSVDSDTGITLGTAVSWSDGDCIMAIDGDGNVSDDAMGAQGIVDDGLLTGTPALLSNVPTAVSTFEGIARSSNAYWKSNVFSTAGALTEANMVTTYLKARKWGNPHLIFTNQLLYSKYAAILYTYKKTANTQEALTGGFTGLEFAAGGPGTVVILDYDVPDTEVYFIDPSTISIGQMTPMQWLDDQAGNVLRRMDYAGFQGVLKWYGNLICKNVRANTKMTAQTSA